MEIMQPIIDPLPTAPDYDLRPESFNADTTVFLAALGALAEQGNVLAQFVQQMAAQVIAAVDESPSAAALAVQLAASSGAQKVGFVASVGGAVPLLLSDKLKALPTPQDAGAAVSASSFFAGPGTGASGDRDGIANVGLGYRCLSANRDGSFSTAVGGNNQNFANGTVGRNTTVGYGTGYNLRGGYSNTAAGFEALHDCREGNANTVYGYGAQHYGLENGGVRDTNNVTAVGTDAAKLNRADSIVAVGYGSLAKNEGDGNTAVGFQAGAENRAGTYSVLLGHGAAASKQTGAYDVYVGFQAGFAQQYSVGYNVAVGATAAYYDSTISQSVAVGFGAAQGKPANVGSNGLVAVGNQALGNCGPVANCVAIGIAASRDETGNNNTSVGAYAGYGQTPGYTGTTNIGYQAVCTGSDQVQLGGSGTTAYAFGAVQNRSDARDKTDVRDTALGLDFIRGLRPVDFRWDAREDYLQPPPALESAGPSPMAPAEPPAPSIPEAMLDTSDGRQFAAALGAGYAAAMDHYEQDLAAYQEALSMWQEECRRVEAVNRDAMAAWYERNQLDAVVRDGSKKRQRFHHGFIAQDVAALIGERDLDFGGYQDHTFAGGESVKSLGYSEFIAPLVKAVQELAAEIDVLRKQARQLRGPVLPPHG